MPKYIINLRDERESQDNYMEWSTVVDAPTTYGMTLDEFKEHYKEEYGNKGMEELDERLKRVAEKGTSARDYASADELIECNRAGEYVKDFVPRKELDNEYDSYALTKEELLDEYCRPTYKDRIQAL